jgi:hypothetical protein
MDRRAAIWAELYALEVPRLKKHPSFILLKRDNAFVVSDYTAQHHTTQRADG